MSLQEPVATPPDDTVAPAASLQASVGYTLRLAREQHGLTIEAVAQTLRLGNRQVEAMENEDWLALPGIATTRGFLRNYARLLEIDPAPLLQQLASALGKTPDNLVLPEQNGATVVTANTRSVNLRPILGGGLALLLAALLYFTLPADFSEWLEGAQAWLNKADTAAREQPAAAQAQNAQAQPGDTAPLFPPGTGPQQVLLPPPPEEGMAAPQGGEREVLPASASPAAAGGIAPAPAVLAPAGEASAPVRGTPIQKAAGEASLSIAWSKSSWVEVRDRDNKVILSQRQAGGAEQTITGLPPFSLIVGYAPGVSLKLRDRPVDLKPHTRGDVARLVLD